MRKRISAFLLAGILLFASGTEGVMAAQASGSTGEQEVMELPGEAIDISKKVGGLRQPILVEMDELDSPVVYNNQEKGSQRYKSTYDIYSTNYYYNQLDTDRKKLWDDLDSMCSKYLTGTGNISLTEFNDGSKGYYTDAVSYSNMYLADAVDVVQVFMFSNPQYYFLDLGIGYYGNYIILQVFDAFANGNARKAATTEMFGVVDNWLAQIKAEPTDLLKEKKAHDLICENVIYDPGYDSLDPDIKPNEYNQSAYSTFVEGITVCAGYSQAMQLLMNGVGIDCGVVTSKEHEWNIIKLNNTWYYVDCTWDDLDGYVYNGITYEVMYGYFNRSKAQYLDTDDPNWIYHVTEALWNSYKLPELKDDSGATFSDIGTIKDLESQTQLEKPAISVSGGKVTITAPSGSNIYYSINDNPSEAFTRSNRYTGTFKMTSEGTVKAIATKSGYKDSPVAELTIKKVTVKLNANGGYIGSTSVKTKNKSYFKGESYGSLASPKRKGYAFMGWFTKKSGGKQVTSKTKVSGATTLYAHWAKIKSKQASISKLNSKKSGQMTVTIKKISTANGYQIKYSLNKNMSSAKTKTVSDNSVTIKNLKKKKTYYVQVRMYQKDSVSGNKKYGSWSKVKHVKIKK